MSVKKLLVAAPRICGAPHASKHGKIAELVWDDEINRNGFPRVAGETGRQRVAFLFDWPCANEKKRDFCLDLVHLTELSHYAAEHGDEEAGVEADQLMATLESQEALYPDVAEILTVEQARRGWWGD